jgi:hypothetical protein
VLSGTTKYCFPSAYLPSGHLKWVLGNPEFFKAFDGFPEGASKTNAAYAMLLPPPPAPALPPLPPAPFGGDEDWDCDDEDSLSFFRNIFAGLKC